MRYQGEVVAVTQDCEIGRWREVAVVVSYDVDAQTIGLVFPNRPSGEARYVNTGADYLYLRPA